MENDVQWKKMEKIERDDVLKKLIETKGSCVVVRPVGELDHHVAELLRNEIDSKVTINTKRIIFDFSNVNFMDSSGIGVIMGRYRLMCGIMGDVGAFGLSPQLDKLITMSGIKKIIDIYANEQEALGGVV